MCTVKGGVSAFADGARITLLLNGCSVCEYIRSLLRFFILFVRKLAYKHNPSKKRIASVWVWFTVVELLQLSNGLALPRR